MALGQLGRRHMKVRRLRNTLCGASILALVSSAGFAQTPPYEMTTDIPPEITTPDVVDTSIGTLNFFDGVPTEETIDTVYDYMDRARAVQAYVSTVPGVSQYRHATGPARYRRDQGQSDPDLGQAGGFKVAVPDRQHARRFTPGPIPISPMTGRR